MAIGAYVLINGKAGKIKDIVGALSKVKGIKSVHACWGRPDIFAYVELADLKALGEFVLDKVQKLEGVEHTDTHIVIGE